ncbi:hypothetical protein D623_10009647 [Myotis brandtii]|uniref:Uncharacterized protein n=1 Tax=Myotis brandtii TaxID=109478 RepID=S7N1J8_MYOBR|nr:hypothetical protein D623_10009647 [Myotis brandtii]
METRPGLASPGGPSRRKAWRLPQLFPWSEKVVMSREHTLHLKGAWARPCREALSDRFVVNGQMTVGRFRGEPRPQKQIPRGRDHCVPGSSAAAQEVDTARLLDPEGHSAMRGRRRRRLSRQQSESRDADGIGVQDTARLLDPESHSAMRGRRLSRRQSESRDADGIGVLRGPGSGPRFLVLT